MNRTNRAIAIGVLVAAAGAAALSLIPSSADRRLQQQQLDRWIAEQENGPAWQRLKRLDQTPGTGGILVNVADVMPPLDPKAMEAISGPAVHFPEPQRIYREPGLTEYDVKRMVRKEIERDRLERGSGYDCQDADCR